MEIQTLQKSVVKIYETTEEIIGTDGQGDEVQEQGLASPVWVKVRDDLLRVLTAYPVISFEKSSGAKYPKEVK